MYITYILRSRHPRWLFIVYVVKLERMSVRMCGSSFFILPFWPNGYVSILWWLITVPGDPQDVRATFINSTAIRVQWRPPLEKDRNGIIRGYHIHVQEAKEEVCNDCLGSHMRHTISVFCCGKNMIQKSGILKDRNLIYFVWPFLYN